MLHFIYGPKEFSKSELKKAKENLLKGYPDIMFFQFDPESASSISIDDLAQGRGLFEEALGVELDGIFGVDAFAGEEKEVLEKIKTSENTFFVLEEKLPKKTLDLIKKYADKVSEGKAAPDPKKDFSAFSLADALGERNKQRLWILFRESVARNYSLEELHGILFWQVKMILLAHKTTSAPEAGVKDFPYSKAKRFTKNFTLKESEELLSKLTSALIDSRENNLSLEHGIERVVLSL